MGIGLPFVGYVKARGAHTVRQDPKAEDNKRHIEKIRKFFDVSQAADRAWFLPFLRQPEKVNWSTCFDEILLETDDVRRPKLTNFLKRAGDRSLVISAWDDLFEVENEVVDRLVKRSLETWSPILRIDQPNEPLTPSILRRAGSRLPFLIMSNQNRVQGSIEARVRPALTTG
jgi:hypothetical protein